MGCDKCGANTRSMRSAAAKTESKMNEVLAYVFHYINCASVDSISKVLLQYYTSDEISVAKQILWDTCEASLPKNENRRKSPGRTAFEAEVSDIVINVKKLDQELKNLPIFGAHDLDRVPKFGPEELDITNLVERINDAEHKLNHVVSVIAKHADEIKGLVHLKHIVGNVSAPKKQEEKIGFKHNNTGIDINEISMSDLLDTNNVHGPSGGTPDTNAKQGSSPAMNLKETPEKTLFQGLTRMTIAVTSSIKKKMGYVRESKTSTISKTSFTEPCMKKALSNNSGGHISSVAGDKPDHKYEDGGLGYPGSECEAYNVDPPVSDYKAGDDGRTPLEAVRNGGDDGDHDPPGAVLVYKAGDGGHGPKGTVCNSVDNGSHDSPAPVHDYKAEEDGHSPPGAFRNSGDDSGHDPPGAGHKAEENGHSPPGAFHNSVDDDGHDPPGAAHKAGEDGHGPLGAVRNSSDNGGHDPPIAVHKVAEDGHAHPRAVHNSGDDDGHDPPGAAHKAGEDGHGPLGAVRNRGDDDGHDPLGPVHKAGDHNHRGLNGHHQNTDLNKTYLKRMVPECGDGSVRPKQTTNTTGKKLAAAFTDSFFEDTDSDNASGRFMPQAWEKKRMLRQERQDSRRRQKKEDKERRRAMSGTLFGSGIQGTLQGAPPKTELFVFRLHRDTTVQKVRKFMKEKNFDVGRIEYRSRRNDRSKNFYVVVHAHKDRVEEIMKNPTFWPEGAGCRLYEENSDTYG